MNTSFSAKIAKWLPQIVVAPSFVAMVIFIYGFIVWNAYLSFSKSRLLPNYDWAGFKAYKTLFALDRWDVAAWNLIKFGLLFIVFCTLVGLFLAILLDQKIHSRLRKIHERSRF